MSNTQPIAIRGYNAVPMYSRIIDSHAKPGEHGGKIGHCTMQYGYAMVAEGKAYWAFQPRIDYPGDLCVIG